MTTLLLDASILLAAFDSDDDQHEPARSLLIDGDVSLAAIARESLDRFEQSRHGAGIQARTATFVTS